ncbi:FtsW/RodA/SpoVE family cell cycle protein [Pseudoflavonifractor sp. 524-17]|uniref:FtsW/RodA/SpoVE family cell cycle protein n=1 Tax=Pseudoflavonifractor sp. 524-17 TaxID=2304577 RepID=UPI001FAC319B|nr:FtsW/RodA/SpoVE family cell cycle protein [Pseudoflavonifractor sp. 524-17]
MLLLSLCVISSGFGLVLIYSATRYTGSTRFMPVQCFAILLGILVYISMSSVDIELFTERSWKFLLAFNLCFIMLTRTPIGVDHGTGNRSWLSIPGIPFELQPAEIVKLTFILLLAWQCSHIQNEDRDISAPSSVLQITGHTLLMFLLIAVASGDFGMGLTYLFIFVIISWVAGVKKRWFLLAVLLFAAMVAAIVLLWDQLGHIYFFRRVKVVIDHLAGNPDTIYEQTMGTGWQQSKSISAIGSGQLTGMGYRKGSLTQSAAATNLPARYNDEIFAVCGEEFGLVGCILLLLLMAALILRCIWVARRACSPQSAYLVMGYAGMLLAQVGVNVAMCLYIFPVVGLTLPFVSYGGSSIITMYAAMGIVSSVKMRSLPSWLRDRSKL